MSLRVLIVGGKFGEVYLNAFLEQQSGLVLAGLLAQGSPRSRQLAKAFGIPLYTAVEQLPATLDVACVVVRSAIVGGAGSLLAESLLRRGLHVIQEHPVHPDEIERLQALATSHRRRYWVNSFYSCTEAGRCFLAAAHAVRSQLDGAFPRFVHLTASRQLLYSSLDLLLQLMPDAAVPSEPALTAKQFDYDEICFTAGSTQIALKLQNFMSSTDPDQHSLVMHHVLAGWSSGHLMLPASYGPVLWVPAFFDEHHAATSTSLYERISTPEGACFFTPAVIPLSVAPRNWKALMETAGPSAAAYILRTMERCTAGEPAPPVFAEAHQHRVAKLWQSVLQTAGAPRQLDLEQPQRIDHQKLIEACAGVRS